MAERLRPAPLHRAWLLPLTVAFLSLGILLGRSAQVGWPFAAGLLFFALAARMSRTWRRSAALLMCVASLGGWLGWQAYHPALPAEDTYTVQGTVIQAPLLKQKGQVQTVLADVTLNGIPASNAYWTFYIDEDALPPEWLVPGAQVALTAHVYHPSDQVNPSGFNFQEYLLQRSITYGLYGDTDLRPAELGFSFAGTCAALRHRLTAELLSIMGEEAGAYAAAMILGTRTYIPSDDRAAFNDLGIAHILSVSGFHVGVLAGMMLLLLRPMPLSRSWRMLTEAALLAGYCLLTGGNAPVIRAALLLLWREFSRVRHKQILPLHLLSTAALLQLLFHPTQLTSASFHLTYGAMLGLLLVYPRLKKQHAFPVHWLQRLWEAFAASCCAQLGILLPQLYWFGQLPLMSVLLNIPVMALGACLILLYWATLVSLPFPWLAEALGQFSADATHLLLTIIRALAKLPATLWLRQPDLPFALGWGILLLASTHLLPRRMLPHRRKLLIAGGLLALTLFIPLPETTTEYTMFSVGNEDTAILQDKDMTIVIDAGMEGQTVASYLHQRRRSVDALIITHLHIDHACGVQALQDEGIPIRVCYLPIEAQTPMIDEETLQAITALQASGTEFRFLRRGDVIDLPSGQLTVLWPEERISSALDANDVPLVLQAEIAGVTMLLTSDLTGAYEHYAALPSDILRVSHHGSPAATSPEFIAAVDPQVLLLSNQLTSREDRMQAIAGSIPLYTTMRHGAVTVRFLGDGQFAIHTMK